MISEGCGTSAQVVQEGAPLQAREQAQAPALALQWLPALGQEAAQPPLQVEQPPRS